MGYPAPPHSPPPDCVTNDEDNIHMQYVKQIDADNVNLSSFLSNINFIDHLCNLCDVLLNTLDSERKKTLFNEIKKINKILPANVYIPFVNHSIRNYVIASIPISEAKIFKTKERAPYMVTLECFRLDELNYYVINNSINISVRLSPEKVNEETYYQINNTETENKKEDNVSGISYLKNQSDFQIGEKIKKRNSGTFNPKKTMETLAEKIMNKTSISEEMTELGVTKTNIKNYSNQQKYYCIFNGKWGAIFKINNDPEFTEASPKSEKWIKNWKKSNSKSKKWK